MRPPRLLMPLAIAIAIATVGCSHQEPASSVSLTAPSALTTPAAPAAGGVSRPAVVDYPARAEALDFRQQLETKYATGLRRPVTTTFVDMEGEVAWVGEYHRYRVNGCDHDTATQRALAQVDGAAPGPVCAVRFFPETAVYPPREHLVDFRRQLGAKYQSMGRNAQSAVDPEGAAIWIGEYLRYRTSGCDHPTAVQKVMTQIDGNPAPESCLVTCAYVLSPPVAVVPSTGGQFIVQPVRTSGACDWIAQSETSWISLNPPITGGNASSLRYTVEANNGLPRSGAIRVSYPAGGTAVLEVHQGSPTASLSFQMFDLATSSLPTTECQIKANGTVCTLSAATNGLPAPVATYDWRVEYAYGGVKVRTQAGPSSTFTFTESCGVSASGGSVVTLSVRLTATDTSGNVVTAISGQATQPALQLRTFNCS